ncbi:LytTR family DNA-binding domain-containing protein [Pelagibacterium sp.]|uniref:LytTR family DNA-binding domain-containing protein n=1 Tax=Pelagibacterium sp. TaxID=1967288 RepID=UPI003BA91886
MNDSPIHFTLRQLHGVFSSPLAWGIMVGVGVIAGITGPFSTFEHLAPAPRIAYWLLIVVGSYGAGTIGATLAQALILPRGGPLIARIAVLGIGSSIPVTAAVVSISWLFFPDLSDTGLSLLELYIYCLFIGLALMGVIEGVVEPQLERRKTQTAPETAKMPKILDRLPKDMRGSLSHMSMADHYVEVHTNKGKSLILMRLSDAIGETEGVEGLQIHRSHRVARAAIAAVRRVDNRVVVELATGERLPVSRSYLATVRAHEKGATR